MGHDIDLEELPNVIRTQQDFVDFVRALSDYGRAPGEDWQNPETWAYLESLAAWVERAVGTRLPSGIEIDSEPSWGLFAQILSVATVYE